MNRDRSAIAATYEITTATYAPMKPVVEMRSPARAGPIIRLALIPTESSAIPLVIPELPSRSWIADLRDGMSSAHDIPVTLTMT